MVYQKIDEIDCGKTTCASKPGEFCKYLRETPFGKKPFCLRYDDKPEEIDGMAQRLPVCVADYTATTPCASCTPLLEKEGCDHCRGDEPLSATTEGLCPICGTQWDGY
jgi:hypothetical protein